jgi:hypothetical protein
MKPLTAAWVSEFPSPGPEGMHCFFNTQEQRFVTMQGPCLDWRSHPERRGKVSWLRFIHAFADQVERADNPFVNEDENDGKRFLLFETDGHTTVDGRQAYSETYLRKKTSDWGLDPIFRVFIHEKRDVTIECYDPDLTQACAAAKAAVDQSYIDEEAAASVAA